MKGPVSVNWKIFRNLQYIYLQSWALFAKQFYETSGRDNFKLHDLKPALCNLESSRIISCHLHLSCTQLLNSHT